MTKFRIDISEWFKINVGGNVVAVSALRSAKRDFYSKSFDDKNNIGLSGSQ